MTLKKPYLHEQIDNINQTLTSHSNTLTNYNSKLSDIATVNASDFATLQEAHDYLTANYSYGVLLIPHDITLTDTFIWDVRKVSLKGYGATIKFNFTDLTKYAVSTISSETVEPYNQSTTLVQGLKFRSAVSTSKCNGFEFYSTAGYKSISHINFRNCEFSYFNKGLDFQERSYAIVFDSCDVYRNIDAIYMGGVLDDCGERISFKDCTIYNNYNAITNKNPNGAFHFSNCSIDYNTNKIMECSDGKLFFFNCHLENRATNFTASNRPIIANGNGGTILIIGGIFMFTSYPSTTMDYVFQNNTSGKGGIFLDQVYILGCRTTTNYLSVGSGYTSIKCTKGGLIEENATIVSTDANLLKDGSFEESSVQDEIFIISDTSNISSRTLTGGNISMSLSGTEHRTGSKSLKVTKIYGNGSNAGFTILVPVSKGSLPGWELYYKKVGAQTGSMGYSYGFCKKALDDVEFEKITVGSNNVTFTSSAVDWTRIKNNSDRPRCPQWATHMFIDINLFNMYAGDLYFDDIVVTEM